MAFDLTLTSPVYGAGRFGNCLTGGKGTVAGVIPGQTLTIRAHIRTSTASGVKVIAGQLGAFYIALNAGVPRFNYGPSASEQSLNGSVSIADGAWHEVEATVSPTAGGKLFVDGVLVASSATTKTMDITTNVFGVRTFGGASGYDWVGDADDVALFSTVQHTAAYTAGSETPDSATDLVAIWKLNDNGLDTAGAVAGATAVTLSGPSTATVGAASSAYTVGANGAITGTVTVTPSDGSGGGTFTPTSVAISAGTPTATFTYTPGSAGAKSISVTNSGGLANPSAVTTTASGSSTTIPVTNSSLLWSPYNWDALAVGDYGVTVASMQTPCCGAYLKFSVTGTTSVALALDTTPNAGLVMPRLMVSINGKPQTFIDLVASSTSLSIATGLTAGSANTVEVYLWGVTEGNGTRWSTSSTVSPTNVLRINGVIVDGGATVSPFPFIRPDNSIMDGDSIVEGVRAAGIAADSPAAHARSSAWFIADALATEMSVQGFGSTGYGTSGSGGMVGTVDRWDKHSVGRPRNFSVAPKRWISMQGTNSTPNVGQLQALLLALRAQFGANTWLHVVVPPGGAAKGRLTSEVAAYKTAYPSDARVALHDISTRVPTTGLSTFATGATYQSIDGIHPNERANGAIGAAIAASIAAVEGGGTGSTTTVYLPAVVASIGNGLAISGAGQLVAVL